NQDTPKSSGVSIIHFLSPVDGKKSTNEKEKAWTPEECDIVLGWLENDKNYDTVYKDNVKKTSIGAPQPSSKISWGNFAKYFNEAAKPLEPLTSDTMRQRMFRYRERYKKALAFTKASGAGLSPSEIKRGVTLDQKLNKICYGFERMNGIFGKNPTFDPLATGSFSNGTLSIAGESYSRTSRPSSMNYAAADFTGGISLWNSAENFQDLEKVEGEERNEDEEEDVYYEAVVEGEDIYDEGEFVGNDEHKKDEMNKEDEEDEEEEEETLTRHRRSKPLGTMASSTTVTSPITGPILYSVKLTQKTAIYKPTLLTEQEE
ncbi:hypothetical protein BGZ49_004322, partial [Haplosporangium sp. Z 27]